MASEIPNVEALVEKGLVKLQSDGAIRIEGFGDLAAIDAISMQPDGAIDC